MDPHEASGDPGGMLGPYRPVILDTLSYLLLELFTNK